jgi:hypothetical protein
MSFRQSIPLAFSLALAACGSSGQVKVAFQNGTPGALRQALTQIDGTPAAPSALAVKLVAIYLVEDQEGATEEGNWLGNNIGNAIKVWTSPDCPSLNDADCQSMGFFDLNRSTPEVNASLNAQAAETTPGTYRYVKLALLGSQQGANNGYVNARWADEGSSVSEQQFASVLTEVAARFDQPLVVGEGESVTVTLTYELAGTVFRGSTAREKQQGQGLFQPGAADDCAGTGTPRTCFVLPTLSVSATK